MSDPARRTLSPWPVYAVDEIAAAADVLRSGRVNYRTGRLGIKFETAYATSLGVRHGLAVANGTVALELALAALGVGPGDDVIVPARTFIATAAAVARCGARPIVADIDRVSHTMTAKTVERALTPATKAVIPVHLGGWPVDMPPLLALARARGLKVVEDCAQAHGAALNGAPVGAFGDVGCFSFCQDKIISTAGEGGLIVTSDDATHRRAWSGREHGWSFDAAQAPDSGEGFRWLVGDFGTNARMTEVQAAVGLIQLGKLPAWSARRRSHAASLTAALSHLPGLTVQTPDAAIVHAYYRFVAMVEPAALKGTWSRNRILAALEARGIPARVGGCPDISRERAFAARGWTTSSPLPDAAWVGERSIALPVHPTLTEDEIAFMADAVAAVVREAAR